MMKTVILAGGTGTRLSEETQVRPKPMVEIGGMPILWHIMKIYGAAGFNEFVLALGWSARHGCDEALSETIAWYRRYFGLAAVEAAQPGGRRGGS